MIRIPVTTAAFAGESYSDVIMRLVKSEVGRGLKAN
jgi:hypothetical protein